MCIENTRVCSTTTHELPVLFSTEITDTDRDHYLPSPLCISNDDTDRFNVLSTGIDGQVESAAHDATSWRNMALQVQVKTLVSVAIGDFVLSVIVEILVESGPKNRTAA